MDKKYFGPLFLFHFWKFVIVEVVLRVHIDYLGFGGRSHYLDNLDQVIDAAFSDKKRNLIDHLKKYTPHRPNINHGCVLSSSEN